MIRSICFAIVVAACPAAADGPAIEAIDVAALETAPTPVEGVSAGALVGAFDAPGLYAVKGEMAAGSIFPPHAHPDQRLTFVVSGTMYLGVGENFDEGGLVAYPAGTAALTPAGTAHFMAAPDGDVVVLELGSGPSGSSFFE